MFAAWRTDRSFRRDNRDYVHDKITAHIGTAHVLPDLLLLPPGGRDERRDHLLDVP
jgi:hypothetical protein